MKVIAQISRLASVDVKNEKHAQIPFGLTLLVGFTLSDNKEICALMAHKIAHSRIFEDENHKINLAIKEVGGEILSISQFTLYSSLKEGRRPSFTLAKKGVEVEELYLYFNECLKNEGLIVKTGVFGANMDVKLINQGPLTFIFDSKELFDK